MSGWQIGLGGAAMVAVTLACGGVGAGSKGSQRAQDLGVYLAEERGIECPVFVQGDTMPWGEVEVTWESFTLEKREPLELSQMQRLRGTNVFAMYEQGYLEQTNNEVLVVTYSVHNPTPVTQDGKVSMTSHAYGEPQEGSWNYLTYHTRAWTQMVEGLVEYDATESVRSGQTLRVEGVWSLHHTDAPGAMFKLRKTENRIDTEDPRGRRRDFDTDCAVVDMGFALPDQ